MIGDCYGVDAAVQKYLNSIDYKNVTVFATNGTARYNEGNWSVHAVNSTSSTKNFQFYRSKDLVMVQQADFGLMIWDEEGKGTLCNMIELAKQHKPTAVYLLRQEKVSSFSDMDTLKKLIGLCPSDTQALFHRLTTERNPEPEMRQVSWFTQF